MNMIEIDIKNGTYQSIDERCKDEMKEVLKINTYILRRLGFEKKIFTICCCG